MVTPSGSNYRATPLYLVCMSESDAKLALNADQLSVLEVLQAELIENYVRACREGLHVAVGVVAHVRGGKPDGSFESIFTLKKKTKQAA